MRDATPIKTRGTPDQPVNLITLRQQKLSEVGTVLPCNACDECFSHINSLGLSPMCVPLQSCAPQLARREPWPANPAILVPAVDWHDRDGSPRVGSNLSCIRRGHAN